jgi:hypothetical protein
MFRLYTLRVWLSSTTAVSTTIAQGRPRGSQVGTRSVSGLGMPETN